LPQFCPFQGASQASQKAHGEQEGEGARGDDPDADEDDVGGQEMGSGHDEIADASGRRDQLCGDERPPTDAERNAGAGQNFRSDKRLNLRPAGSCLTRV
jgi:hypothetical protein